MKKKEGRSLSGRYFPQVKVRLITTLYKVTTSTLMSPELIEMVFDSFSRLSRPHSCPLKSLLCCDPGAGDAV